MNSWAWLIFYVLGAVAIIIFVIVALFRAFLRQRRRHGYGLNERDWYLQLSLLPKDAISQWFLVLGSLALANTIYVINNNFGDPLSWRSILLISVLIFAAVAYFGKSVYTAAIGIVGFLVWWMAQTSFWQAQDSSQYYTTLAVPVGLMWLSILLYAAGFSQIKRMAWKRFSIAYMGIGLVLANFLLFAFSTESGLRFLQEMTTRGAVFDVWQNVIALLVVGGLVTVSVLYGWSKKILMYQEVAYIIWLFLLFGLLITLPAQSLIIGKGAGQLTGAGLFWAVIFNFTLLFEILGVIFVGYLRREIWMINFGAVLLVIFVAVKYFDWFFKFMDKSVFFIIAGILLFTIGWAMERGRRYLAQSAISNSQNR